MSAEKSHSPSHPKPLIFFLRVVDAQSKLRCICETIQFHFKKKERVLLIVPSEEAARYIDLLLWRHPEESFLPHIISTKPSNEAVVITTTFENLNNAVVLFNLCNVTNPIFECFEKVYELLDETHPEKQISSIQRRQAYEAKGYAIH